MYNARMTCPDKCASKLQPPSAQPAVGHRGWLARMSPASRGIALLSAAAMICLLGVRLLNSPDLGYHLSYGYSFLETGRPVDSSPMVYSLDQFGPGNQPPPGPGCWWDDSGQYRFANANWGTQVVMALVDKAGGVWALGVLQAVLAAGVFAVTAATMRRLGLGCLGIATGLLLTALVSYERLNLRPEVFGYIILAGELLVLTGWRPSWLWVAGLVVLQLVLVNVHSYFMLGVALTGAFWAQGLWRWLRAGRLRPKAQEADAQSLATARRTFVLLSAALAGQLAVCFANPWTWRLAVLPVETLLFISRNDITTSSMEPGHHPWSYIGEFFRPLASDLLRSKASIAYLAMLGLAGVGGLCCLLKRRWAWALIIAAMTMVSLSMRRNIAPAAIVIVPLALAALVEILGPVAGLLGRRLRALSGHAWAAGLTVAALTLATMIVNQSFYTSEYTPVRFGMGLDRLMLPVDGCDWIARHDAGGRIWCDYDSSSSVHWFTGRRPVPILTNTWAYPPVVMQQVLDASSGQRDLPQLLDELEADVLLLRVERMTAQSVRTVTNDKAWAMVHLSPVHVVWVRRLAHPAVQPITEETFDAGAYIAHAQAQQAPEMALRAGGITLYQLGWYSHSIEVLERAVAVAPRRFDCQHMLAVALATRGLAREMRQDHRGRADWQRARQEFQKALQLKDDPDARQNLATVERQLQAISRGLVLER